MKNKYSKKRYKLNAGVQQITPDTADYSKAYELQAEEGAKNQGIKNAASQFSGAYAPVGQLGGMASDVIKSHNKSKGGAQLGGAVSMGASGAALGMQLGGPWGAAIGAVGGGIYGGITGGKEYEKGKKLQEEEDKRIALANAQKLYKSGSSTDAQSFLAKKGKYKLKTKQPRLIETEGREPIFSPKKADGTRDLLYYNPDDPTHEEGGVKAVVMPKNKYTNGTKQLMSQRKPYKNPEITPPTPYELMPKPPKSRYEKGGKYIKVYAEGSKGVSLAFSRGEKDPKGGLTQKGVDKYNRATGGNLKMAVTTLPSKLKAGSKDANRRKSFCARMSGVDGPMEKNGKPTRKALALRKWNC
jgi:hypothetical protein